MNHELTASLINFSSATEPETDSDTAGPLNGCARIKPKVTHFKFPGTLTIKPSIEEEALVPIPKSLYNQLMASPINLISETEPESSSDYKLNSQLKAKCLCCSHCSCHT